MPGTPATARRFVKAAMQRLPTDRDAVVVASFGRAGSTLVYHSIAEAMARRRFHSSRGPGLRVVTDEAFDLGAQPLRRGVVYKTHDYPQHLTTRQHVRAVFLFGSAVDSALSVHAQGRERGEVWTRQHFEHLRRPYRFSELLREDVLGIRDQCAAWMGFDAVPVLCVRYERLWDNTAALADFCGLDVALPDREERAPKQVDPGLLEAVRAAYGSIDRDLAQLPDCFVAAPELGARMQAGAPGLGGNDRDENARRAAPDQAPENGSRMGES